ncbi:hypothetical protein Gogos_020222 [Gossypium gossypioides]|uniref:MADS-box domain-containing protein n=1 Tax=Gossypium gossypioides TaxID=34282 RepID=A0A7J9D0S1_GOSGO|nr:hypothetical protein [Gossypium gossypioides]
MKKVTELPTMCGVEGGLIVYCPDEQEPMVWPSHEKVQSLLKKFYQVPEMERNKKSMKLETYYKEKASKSRDQLKKQTRKTKEIDDLRLPRSSLRDTGSSSLSPHIQQPIPSHSGNLSIVPEPRLARFAYGDNSCATTAPTGPMPPFGYESSSSVLIANLELPTFETFSKVFGGASKSYGTIGNCEIGPFDDNH